MDSPQQKQIGEFAAAFDLNPKTVRYYERIGLLPEPDRSAAGYRLYGPRDHDRMAFVIKAKRVGFTLEEIREVLSLRADGEQPCAHVLALVDEKITTIDVQLQTLRDLQGELADLKREALEPSGRNGAVCGIIEEHEPGRA